MFNKISFNKHRVRELHSGEITGSGPVIYWMSRDQRVADNWALTYSISKANALNVPVKVAFTLAPSFPGAGLRQYDFMLKGLKQVEQKLLDAGIDFQLLKGNPAEMLAIFIEKTQASLIVSDFDPLMIKRDWKSQLNERILIPHYEVDAHNIVPCWIASPKAEFGAYTIRPKIKKHLSTFLTDFEAVTPSIKTDVKHKPTNWHDAIVWLKPSNDVKPVETFIPGEDAANDVLHKFISDKLNGYSTKRNNPNIDGQSNLSPYLHFGQISAQRIAIEILKSTAPEEDKKAFLEELIIRRELSDNFCLYNPAYSRFSGFPEWAKESHKLHRFDVRKYLYSLSTFENAQTHDPLWNAAQMEMVHKGKMHGYMRMYWAKKILEWTTCPEEAIQIAIYLNDKYSIDGRDPNGFTGVAWSIGGVHDRPWPEKPIFGKIRFMNFEGCKRKFNVDEYIANNLK